MRQADIKRITLAFIIAAIAFPIKLALEFLWEKSNESSAPEVWLRWCVRLSCAPVLCSNSKNWCFSPF